MRLQKGMAKFLVRFLLGSSVFSNDQVEAQNSYNYYVLILSGNLIQELIEIKQMRTEQRDWEIYLQSDFELIQYSNGNWGI